MSETLYYVSEGCIVEFFSGSTLEIGMFLEDMGKRCRLLLSNGRETNMQKNRLLPWVGPKIDNKQSRDTLVACLLEHKKKREQLSQKIALEDLWAAVQGEIPSAPAQWFAELDETNPTIDTIASYARAMLSCKTHFHFANPVFEIYSAEKVALNLAQKREKEEKERIAAYATQFLHTLWDCAKKNTIFDSATTVFDENLSGVFEHIERVLRNSIEEPEYLSLSQDPICDVIQSLSSDTDEIALKLLIAWGKIPPHYNIWLDRAHYEGGDHWWGEYRDTVAMLAQAAKDSSLPFVDLPFISIDGSSTRDIDDAFYLERKEDGWHLTLAFANPALAWPFDGEFDRCIRTRTTSLYFPEQTCHMLPECLGTESYSLLAGCTRPAFIITLCVHFDGSVQSQTPSFGRVCVTANLQYEDCEKTLDRDLCDTNPSYPYRDMLAECFALAQARENFRIQCGALFLERQEPSLTLQGEGFETRVLLEEERCAKKAKSLVSECMILAAAGCAKWASERNIPMLYRALDIQLGDIRGHIQSPVRIAQVLRLFLPPTLEVSPQKHVPLGVSCYAPVTSPLRRYIDLINVAQIQRALVDPDHCFSKWELTELKGDIIQRSRKVGSVQRARIRYWKYLYFKQQGERVWWQGVVTAMEMTLVVVTLPLQDIVVRGRQQLFGDRVRVGTPVLVRLGRVNPYVGEMQIIEGKIAPEEIDPQK